MARRKKEEHANSLTMRCNEMMRDILGGLAGVKQVMDDHAELKHAARSQHVDHANVSVAYKSGHSGPVSTKSEESTIGSGASEWTKPSGVRSCTS